MARNNRLEPLGDGRVASHGDNGEPRRHKGLTGGRVGGGERVFIPDTGLSSP